MEPLHEWGFTLLQHSGGGAAASVGGSDGNAGADQAKEEPSKEEDGAGAGEAGEGSAGAVVDFAGTRTRGTTEKIQSAGDKKMPVPVTGGSRNVLEEDSVLLGGAFVPAAWLRSVTTGGDVRRTAAHPVYGLAGCDTISFRIERLFAERTEAEVVGAAAARAGGANDEVGIGEEEGEVVLGRGDEDVFCYLTHPETAMELAGVEDDLEDGTEDDRPGIEVLRMPDCEVPGQRAFPLTAVPHALLHFNLVPPIPPPKSLSETQTSVRDFFLSTIFPPGGGTQKKPTRSSLHGGGTQKKPAAMLLSGPRGSGKRAAVRLAAQQLGCLIHEVSAAVCQESFLDSLPATVSRWTEDPITRTCAVVFLFRRCDDVLKPLKNQGGAESKNAEQVHSQRVAATLRRALECGGSFAMVFSTEVEAEELSAGVRETFSREVAVKLPDQTTREQALRRLVFEHVEFDALDCSAAGAEHLSSAVDAVGAAVEGSSPLLKHLDFPLLAEKSSGFSFPDLDAFARTLVERVQIGEGVDVLGVLERFRKERVPASML